MAVDQLKHKSNTLNRTRTRTLAIATSIHTFSALLGSYILLDDNQSAAAV